MGAEGGREDQGYSHGHLDQDLQQQEFQILIEFNLRGYSDKQQLSLTTFDRTTKTKTTIKPLQQSHPADIPSSILSLIVIDNEEGHVLHNKQVLLAPTYTILNI